MAGASAASSQATRWSGPRLVPLPGPFSARRDEAEPGQKVLLLRKIGTVGCFQE